MKYKLAAGILALQLLAAASPVPAAELKNLTGLPAYPNLATAAMDGVARTDTLGRWCTRFAADTSDSLTAVEAWYRKVLIGASETDLTHDKTYKIYAGLSGIKLALGIDYVTVFKSSNQAPTSIELFRCSPSAAKVWVQELPGVGDRQR